MGRIGERHAHVLGLPAGITAGQVLAEQSRGRMAEHLVGEMLLAIGALADREVAAPALLAFAADDGEGHDDAVADLELAVDPAADLDDLSHHFVPMMSPGSIAGMKSWNRWRSEPQIAQLVTCTMETRNPRSRDP